MASLRFKFRLGADEHIVLRGDRYQDGVRCRARARLGRLKWFAVADLFEAEVAAFVTAVISLVNAVA